MKQTYGLIDLFKFFASILIFTFHCEAFADYGCAGFILEILTRWGVPFFFICSSFFLFSKSVDGNINKTTLFGYLRRIALLYLLWFIFNIPNTIFLRLITEDLSSIKTWLVFIKESVLSSTFTGSWFLSSCMFSAVVVYRLCKRHTTRFVLLVTFALYLLCIFTSEYQGLLPVPLAEALDFLVFPLNIVNGCFYFATGKFIAENKDKLINRFSPKSCLILIGVFFLDFGIETVITKHFGLLASTDAAFSLIGIAIFLFLFCIKVRINIKDSFKYRKLSTIIYCCQGNALLVDWWCRYVFGISAIVSFLYSFVFVAIICTLVLFIQKKGHLSWADYLT